MTAAGGLSLQAQAAMDIRVTYAGSMGKVMDQALGPAFAQQHDGKYEGQGQGAYGMARLLASKKITADVFVTITPGPMQILKDAGLIDNAVPVASTSMVIAYNPKGPFAPQFAAAKDNNGRWLQLLAAPGLKFGRTDPVNDPKGQNIIFTLLLAQKYYRQPGIADNILGGYQNPAQTHLPYIALPDEINLSNPAMATKWYNTVSFSVKDSQGKDKVLHTQPLVYYAAVLRNAPHGTAAGKAFVDFMLSPSGQALFKQQGYAAPKGDGLYTP
ncbi:ABC transporter substrate-binding protein [Pantoea sp. Ap-870]|uniref:extracellular solute-binding protein n=1 Tax=Pantoea sp. Ap-870 TaxID=2608358 RepID=UPI001419360B|nr:extracellular solute-binding protein [Pantoea sp. Ap-870]NIE51967.1 ABC transporter substrate-binding protein [Pantoea sp. Ap-870]